MPTAKLKTASSLHIAGTRDFAAQVFLHGVETNVSESLFDYLEENHADRFRLRARGVVEEVVKPSRIKETQSEASAPGIPDFSAMGLKAAIQAATDYMNPDIEANFDEDGKPSLMALQFLLQRPVTEEDRDEAIGRVKTATSEAGAALLAERAETKGRGKITVRKASQNADASVEGAVSV